MQFNKFLDEYWDVFLNHICIFYDFNIDILKEFKYDLYWNKLAYNQSLEWNDELISISRANKNWIKNLIAGKGRETYHDKLKNLTEEQFSNLESILDDRSSLFHEYGNLYVNYILPKVDEIGLEKILRDKLNYDQKYFLMEPVQYDSKGHLNRYKKLNVPAIPPLFDNSPDIALPEIELIEEDSRAEGLPRMYETLKAAYYGYPNLIISENIKAIIEQFNIPPHYFIPLRLDLKTLTTNLKYYLLVIESDSLLKMADFKNVQFYYKERQEGYKRHKKKFLKKGEIKNFEDILPYRRENDIRSDLVPTEYKIQCDLDVFSIRKEILVSEEVKTKIESYLDNQVHFKSAQLHNLRIVRSSNAPIAFSDIEVVQSENIVNEEIQFYFDKMEKLENEEFEIETSIVKDEFYDIQHKLKVIIPESVKEKYRKLKAKHRPHFHMDSDEYDRLEEQGIEIIDDQLELLEIHEFRHLQEYASMRPETYNALAIGFYGDGDEVGLLLEKDDFFQLQEKLYYFSHDDGGVYEYTDDSGHFT